MLAESSSSPSVKVSYARIIREPRKGGYQLLPREGSPFFISTTLFLHFKLHVDEEVDEQTAHALYEASQKEGCYLQGLSYLARSEHTTLRLRQKLLQKGYAKELVETTLEVLAKEGSLSDLRYARLFIEKRQQKNPEGRFRLAQRLAQKGVERTASQQALDELFTDELIPTYIATAIERAQRTYPNQKVTDVLRSWGFSSSEIQRGLEELDDLELPYEYD